MAVHFKNLDLETLSNAVETGRKQEYFTVAWDIDAEEVGYVNSGDLVEVLRLVKQIKPWGLQ